MATDRNLHNSLTGNGWTAHKNDTYTRNGETIYTSDNYYKSQGGSYQQHKNGRDSGR